MTSNVGKVDEEVVTAFMFTDHEFGGFREFFNHRVQWNKTNPRLLRIALR